MTTITTSNDRPYVLSSANNHESLRPTESKEFEQKDLRGSEDGSESPTSTLASSGHHTLLEGHKLASVLFALLLSIFLIVLDRTIVATAIPVVTSDFNGLAQAPWIASAYFLTQGGCMLTFGQILSVAPMLYVYLSALLIFEIGSVMCGAANSMTTLIAGRAVAGIGSSGVMVGTLAIVSKITRLDQRAMVFGFFAGTLALGSIVGPLLGGALTEKVSWRWCFYINLPLGAVTVLSILLFMRPSAVRRLSGGDGESVFQKVAQIDWIGSVLYFGCATTVLLALQWGGVEKPWDSKVIIVLFAVGGVLFIAFLLWEHYRGAKAVLPLKLFTRKTTSGAAIEAFMIMLFVMVGTYYLPLFYQSAKEKNAVSAGIDVLPFMLSTVVGNAVSSVLTTRTGKPWPWLFGGPLVASLASGLLFWCLTKSNAPHGVTASVVVFQCILGLGAGSCVQQSLIVAQAEYKTEPKLIPQVSAMINAMQLFGGMVGVAVSGTIFSNKLRSGLSAYAPDLDSDIKDAVVASVSALAEVPQNLRDPVLRAYSNALGYVFIIGVPVGVVASLASLIIERHNLKKPSPPDNKNELPSTAGPGLDISPA